MRVVQSINKDWTFIKNFADIPATIPAEAEVVSIPHTWNGLDRTYMALDYFDASINRISAWVVGFRSWQMNISS